MAHIFRDWEESSVAELQETQIYKSLNKKGQIKAGHTVRDIVTFFKDLFPFNYETLHDFGLAQLKQELASIDFNVLYKDFASGKRNLCKREGIMQFISIMCNFLFFKRATYYKISPFIPIYATTGFVDKVWELRLHHNFYTGLLFSRYQYLTRGEYLPIVVQVTMLHQDSNKKVSGHAITVLYIPNNDSLFWNRIILDTSRMSQDRYFQQDYQKLLLALDTQWQNFIVEKNKYQVDTVKDLNFKDVFAFDLGDTPCLEEIQGKHGTCAYWSFGFIIHFLYQYKHHPKIMSNANLMTYWCQSFAAIVQDDRIRNTYVEGLIEFLSLVMDLIDKYVLHYVDWKKGGTLPQSKEDIIYNLDQLSHIGLDAKDTHRILELIQSWNLFQDVKLDDLYSKYNAQEPSYMDIVYGGSVKVKQEKPEEKENMLVDYVDDEPGLPKEVQLSADQAVAHVLQALHISPQDHDILMDAILLSYPYLKPLDIKRAINRRIRLDHEKSNRKIDRIEIDG